MQKKKLHSVGYWTRVVLKKPSYHKLICLHNTYLTPTHTVWAFIGRLCCLYSPTSMGKCFIFRPQMHQGTDPQLYKRLHVHSILWCGYYAVWILLYASCGKIIYILECNYWWISIFREPARVHRSEVIIWSSKHSYCVGTILTADWNCTPSGSCDINFDCPL